MGITPADPHTFPDICEHRLHMSHVGSVLNGGIHCLSAYLIDGQQLNDANMAILEHAAAALNALKAPWVMAADWNVNPEQLAA